MTNDPCQTLLFGPPPNYMDVCGEPAVGRWRSERRCRKHLLEMEANTCGEAANVRWDLDPAEGPLFWLCLPIILVYAARRVTLAWLKTKLPHAPAPVRRCQECGWELAEEQTSLLCGKCEWEQEQEHRPEPAWIAEAWALAEQIAAASVSKLFCCDVDLEYQRNSYSAGAGHYQSTRVYRCPTCSRIWLYIYEWHQDSGSDADWYPQQTAHDDRSWPYLFDERTRTKVYR